MTSILFVCTANRYRSPIAAACFQAELTRRGQTSDWEVSSAGTWAVEDLPPVADAIIKARLMDLDIQNHRSRTITESMLQEADLVLVMERGHKEALQIEFAPYAEKVALLSEVATGVVSDIPDPVMDPQYTDAVPEIHTLIQAGFEDICARAVQNHKR
ncbi:MAG: hypothetical protein AB1649_04660 [Chloroflexota bacterium]